MKGKHAQKNFGAVGAMAPTPLSLKTRRGGGLWGVSHTRTPPPRVGEVLGQVVALRGHCVHTAHAEAGILTQEYPSPDWLHSKAAKPT